MRLLFLLILFLTSWNSYSQIQKVLIIGIDGCRADALELANTPNLDALMFAGTYSFDALNDDITYSGPGWSAMLTGVWSDKHGVTDNSFNGSNYGNYPHFFQYVEDHNPSLNTASICHWNPINDNILAGIADYSLNVISDAALTTEAITYLTNNDPDVLFLHFDECDGVGHASGFTSNNPTYIDKIESTDSYIGSILNSLTNRPNYINESWLILSSTDHGGIGTSHGGSSIEEERIFFIASGSDIPQQQILPDSTLTPIAGNCLNNSTELQFDGVNDYVEIPNVGTFNFGNNRDFTIECRVRTNQAADVSIVGNKDWDSGFNSGVVFSFRYASGPEWKVNIGDGSQRADLNYGGYIADNNWHTLTVTFDRDGEMKMYEDGYFIDGVAIDNIGDIDSGFPFRFGADPLGDYTYNGSISEVRIWGSVLNPLTINAWHCSSINFSHPNYNDLLGYWKMDEGIGSTQVMDFSANSNHGSINGATWATSPSHIITYDYSNTPRITDIALTALSHLCIPIDPSWDLDGRPIFSSCPDFLTECTDNSYTLPYVYQSNYHAIDSIDSTAKIQGSSISFKAGERINLDIGFEAGFGSNEFQAVIDSCQ